MIMVSNWSFQNGFLDYINRSELNKLEGLGIALEELHQKEGNWLSLENNRRLWHRLIREWVLNPVQPRESTLMRSSRDTRDSPKLKDRRQDRPNGRLYLLDKDKKILIGPPAIESDVLYKAMHSKEQIIGYIAIGRRQQLSHKLDQVFAEQQRRSYLWIALGSILISILISLPFANQLIKPILELLRGTQELAKGNYQSRVKIKSYDEVGKLAKSFNSMADNIEAHQKTQQQWLADISHELRTPLAVLKGEIEAIIDGIRKPNEKSIQSLHQEVNYINRLVEDLHELAKSDIKALHLQKENFLLRPVIEEAFDIFKTENAHKQLKLLIDCDSSLNTFSDKDRLTQVFINLFQNNIRYTEAAGKIHITVNKDSNISILWEDSGPGVEPKNLEKLFDRLYREDISRTSFTKGSGLGLSICRSIIENHQGSMHAYQAQLGGLGINITLPN